MLERKISSICKRAREVFAHMAGSQLQRRLSAILAADVVGYSRLMGEDEEGTLVALTSHRTELFEPRFADHNGRLVKTTGDGFLVEFSSVVDAVRCALSIQEHMRDRNATIPEDRQIVLRIGINLGDVIVQDDDVYGDGVNVAARLEGLAEPGGICLSRAARDQVRDRLDIELEDLGETTVKNIARPVQIFRVTTGTDSIGKMRAAGPSRWLRRTAITVLAALVVVGSVAWWTKPWDRLTDPPTTDSSAIRPLSRPAIAVIPFRNLSGDPTQDYFSDGLTEDIIHALGRYRDLAVMAYNATLPFRGATTNPKEIRRRLSVRYLVEGTVRRTGEKVRISIKLTDAQKGTLLWSERFDNENKDILSIQDAITRRVAGTLITNLTRVEQRRALSKSTANMGAYDLVLRGRAELRRATRSANRRARRMFERAAEIDSNYAAAYSWLARGHYQVASDGWSEFPSQALEHAQSFAQKALTLDPLSVEALRTLARIHAVRFQVDRALAVIDQAISINPSDAEALGDRGVILVWSDKPKEALAAFEPAFIFDPNLRGDYVFSRGLSYYLLRRHKEAIKILERGASRYPNYVFIRAALVAAYGQLGKVTEAHRNAEEVKRLLPIFDPKVFGSRLQDPALRKYLTEGLKKGGLY
jgi:adenylate cyclase